MIPAVDTMNYQLIYENIFGGVVSLTREQFEDVNGFSNQFWGWGGEDDDMNSRIKKRRLKVSRYSEEIARY